MLVVAIQAVAEKPTVPSSSSFRFIILRALPVAKQLADSQVPVNKKSPFLAPKSNINSRTYYGAGSSMKISTTLALHRNNSSKFSR